MENKKQKKEFMIATVLLAGYFIFNIVLLFGHELWRDEANVWLFAREASPIQLLREIKYQGHPCLWYFLVMPFAKLGFPFQTISVLSFLIMTAAAAVFAYRAPFHPITKAVCLFSPIFSYYYSVVARNYCLIALILILLAYFFPVRKEKSVLYGLLLGLLVQADTIAIATAGLISCMLLFESIYEGIKKKEWKPLLQALKGLWIPLVSLLLWVAQFYQVSDSPEYQMKLYSITELISEIRNFSYHIINRMTGQGESFFGILLLLFAVTGIGISIIKKSIWPLVVMVGTFLFEVLFSIMVYQLHIWHYITLCFVLLWFLWVGYPRERDRKFTVTGIRILGEGFLLILGVTMFVRWNAPEESSSLSNALYGLYSDGVHVAEYIEENVGPDEVIISTDVPEASTVQAYLGKEYAFYYAGSMQKEIYAKYNDEQRKVIAYDDLKKWAMESFPEKDSVYLLLSKSNCIEGIPETTKEEWELCYQTQEESARGEDYCLYRIGIR